MKTFLIALLTVVMLGSVYAQVKKDGSSTKNTLQVVDPEKAKTNSLPVLPSIISHQGYIADSTGAGLNGTFPMTFKLWTDSTSGLSVLTQLFSSVTLAHGVFNVNLDVSSISSVFTNQIWLETSINGQTLTPRTRLTSAPYALHALAADTAQYARAGAGTYSIGQYFEGGIIFYVDSTGQHGLIAATSDQSTGLQWYNGSNTTTNATRDGIGAGMYNTQLIISSQGATTTNYAAGVCAAYQGGGYGDWYLPSKYELNLLYLQYGAVGGFILINSYWSSTENSSGSAWDDFFLADGSLSPSEKVSTDNVRAVRAF